MASVFLSYDREDAGMARPIAAALEKAGHSVWWDRHIKGGAQYSKEIDKALKSAHAIVVLWSERSVESAWVRDEAAAGRDTARLVPVSLDSTEPPLGFRQYQTIELEGWRGRGRVPRLAELLGAIDALGSAETEADTPPRVPRPGSIARSRRFMPIGLAVMLLVAAAILAWWLSRPSIPIPTVAVAAADGSAPSQALARDLLTKLGSLQAAQADSIMLAEHGEGAGRGADLVFEVGGTAGSTEVEANLVLLSGNNRTVLWSRDFRQPLSKFPDLKQHVAYTAALVLDCTLEGISAKAQRLDERTLKLYLNGCAASAGAIHEQFPGLAATFRGVVREAPEFEAAWARLLLVEANIAEAHPLDDIARPIGEELRRHIAAARKLNPTLAEADIAEASLLPKQAIGQRVQVLERAVRNNPDNPHAASTLSQYLGSVGRMRDAVRLARRAVQLAPLSPSARETLIAALTYSGNFDAARDELERAERLWPGASNLQGVRYAFNLRYGDPREALRLQVSRSDAANNEVRRAYLEARIDPSPEKISRAIAGPRGWFARYPEAIPELAQTLATFDREEELFPILLNWRHPESAAYAAEVLFRPAFSEFHRDPRMMAVGQRLGLLDYWRSSGHWPDFCFEPDLPYDCKAEAAKLLAQTS